MNTLRAILMLDQSGAKLTDEFGNASGVSLEMLFGAGVRLELDLRSPELDNDGKLSSYPTTNLSGASKYYFALNDTFTSATTPKYLQFTNAGVETVQGKTIFYVNLSSLNSEALSSALTGKESAVFHCEFGGEDSQTPPSVVFCFQFQLTIRNRIYPGAGSAVIAGDPAYYTALETEAAIGRTISGGTDQSFFHPQTAVTSGGKLIVPLVSSGAITRIPISTSPVSIVLDSSGVPANTVGRFTILLDTASAATIVYPAAWKWQNDVLRISSGGIYPLELYYSSGAVLARSFLDCILQGKIDNLEESVVARLEDLEDNTGAMSETLSAVSGAVTELRPGITSISGGTIVPQNGKVYSATVSSGASISIQSGSVAAPCTFEMWLTQGATAVTFSLPSGIWWEDGGTYASSGTAPSMSTANTTYCVVVRYDGSRFLANLAYKVVTA